MNINEQHSPILTDKEGNVSVSIPLCDKAYRDLYNDRANPVLRDKELAFVVITNHYNSSLVKRGLEGDEMIEAARQELGLSSNWVPSQKVIKAVQHYKKVQDSSIAKYVINLHKQYANRNKSVELIGNKISLLHKHISEINAIDDTTLDTVMKKIDQVVQLEKALDALSKSVPEQIKNFKAAILELKEDATMRTLTQGQGKITNSMDPNNSVINQA